MRKIVFLIFALMSVAAFSQRTMEVKDVTPDGAVYSGEENEAAVIVTCPVQMYPLTFESSMDAKVDVRKVDSISGRYQFTIVFQCGKRYRGRSLTITSNGYTSLIVDLELEPKQYKKLDINDPNATVGVSCYRENRNKGNEAFKKGDYDEALDYYRTSTQCSDVDSIEIGKLIAVSDTLRRIRNEANAAYETHDFVKAIQLYAKCVTLNPDDKFIVDRQNECEQSHNVACYTNFNNAETYYNNKNYDSALTFYKKVVSQNCLNSSMATARIVEIEQMRQAKHEHSHVLSYEISSGCPIGISSGSYHFNRVGGYFSLRFNTKIFDAMRNEPKFYIPSNIALLGKSLSDDEDDKINENPDFLPEINLSFGWTIPIFHTDLAKQPISTHIFVGPGFTGMMQYKWSTDAVNDFNTNGYSATIEEDELVAKNEKYYKPSNYDKKFLTAISPEIGVVLKWSYVAFRYTFQYRFATKKSYEDVLGKTRSVIGIGVAF
ncbi:MAG: tetratricopeptide repeat protein [Muribaculaceae bacterium]|jgi:hypothetical protein|nr:tetratricopeptide repeat protein [Muribaculaceae bacterium]